MIPVRFFLTMSTCFICIQWICLTAGATDCQPLPNSSIRCHELVQVVVLHHSRSKRQLSPGTSELHFSAFGRNFSIDLKENRHVIERDLNIEIVEDGSVSRYDMASLKSLLYIGTVRGETSSFVEGWINFENNEFDGSIIVEDVQFFIEPLSRYFSFENYNETFRKKNTVIYRASDIVVNQSKPAVCGGIKKTGDKPGIIRTVVSSKEHFEKWKHSVLRFKRQHGDSQRTKVCSLHVVADHSFFTHTGLSSVGITIKEMTHHILNADAVFRTTKFDGRNDHILGLKVGKITIYKNQNGFKYLLKDNVVEATTYLKFFGKQHDFKNFCLGLGYTYRDFPHGVVGLAYIGNVSYSINGGICARNEITRSGRYSVNAAIVTGMNYGMQVSRLMISVTTAHEIGHTFGSDHDPPKCSPGGARGNYVMYHISGTGLLPHHRIFSQCSISQIWLVVLRKGTCFVNDEESTCGNGVKENGEECDCGDVEQCPYIDRCCVPATTSGEDGTPCTVKKNLGYKCSSNSPCCNPKTCQLYTRQDNVQCELGMDCQEESYCDGANETCPIAQVKRNDSPCGFGSKLCLNGLCNTTLCAKHGLHKCECSEEKNMCKLCCHDKNSGRCTPYKSHGGKEVLFSHGETCDEYNGICTATSTCYRRQFPVMEGRFVEGLSNVAKAFKKYWYIVVIIIILLAFGGVVLYINFFASHDYQALAYQTGNFARVWFEVKRQALLLYHKSNLASRFTFQRNSDCDQASACGRLMAMFPTVKATKSAKLVSFSSHEEFAVRVLLILGYPMRVFKSELHSESVLKTSSASTISSMAGSSLSLITETAYTVNEFSDFSLPVESTVGGSLTSCTSATQD